MWKPRIIIIKIVKRYRNLVRRPQIITNPSGKGAIIPRLFPKHQPNRERISEKHGIIHRKTTRRIPTGIRRYWIVTGSCPRQSTTIPYRRITPLVITRIATSSIFCPTIINKQIIITLTRPIIIITYSVTTRNSFSRNSAAEPVKSISRNTRLENRIKPERWRRSYVG